LGNSTVKSILIVIIALFAACSSSNKIITSTDGTVSERRYISPKEIPGSYSPGKYLLGYGDVIDIALLHNEKYNRNHIKIRPDGLISYPYVGEIEAGGRTIEELDSVITSGFSEIIKRPDISIIIREFKPMNIYVLGEVEAPGAYETTKLNTLLDALSIAGGMTEKAKRNGVIIIRKTGPDHIVGIQVDLNKILKENRYEYNIGLEGNDIVLVPQSRVSRFADFIKQYTSVLKEPFDLLGTFYYIRQAQATYEYLIVRED